ncbi:MAG: hypothetical protein HZA49_06765 [Planctomycetes bacterium]|nr:hypothetical protein [Planctomycetota bacterium]
MKIISKGAIKRIVVVVLVIIVGYVILNQFCCVIETTPYIAPKLPYREFVPAKSGKGELFFDAESQVLIMVLRGSPAELGSQQGILLKPQLNTLVSNYLNRFLHTETGKAYARQAMESMKKYIPKEYLEEIAEMSKASGVSLDDILLLHTIIDEPKFPMCSVIISSGLASKDKQTIFGRNLDYLPLGIATYYNMITIYHPDNKKSFASIIWPGFAGVLSGINQDGLAIAMLVSLDGTDSDDGMPSVILLRKIMENASDINQAIEVIKSADRSAPINLAMVDANNQSVIAEITHNRASLRYPEKGLLFSTNWFVSPDMNQVKGDNRYVDMVRMADKYYGQLDMEKVISVLRAVKIDNINLQSMVIFPKERILYFASGSRNAANGYFRKIDLNRYLK